MNRQKGKESRAIAVNALAAALVCIGTMAIQIPIPLGYMHLGNACILLMAAMFGPVTGMLAGGIGSAMADLLTGYTQWVLPTLLIKCAMGFVSGAGKRAQPADGFSQDFSRLNFGNGCYGVRLYGCRSSHERQHLYGTFAGARTDR